MRSRRRMQHTGENVAETRRAHAQLKSIHKTESRLTRVLAQLDRNQSASGRSAPHASCYFFNRSRGKARIMHPADVLVALKLFCQLARVVTLSIEPPRQRLSSAKDC